MTSTSKPIKVPDQIVVDGHTYYPGHKRLLESLPPDMVREMARKRMMAIEAAGVSYFPELHTAFLYFKIKFIISSARASSGWVSRPLGTYAFDWATRKRLD
jgi:hypothetical protein